MSDFLQTPSPTRTYLSLAYARRLYVGRIPGDDQIPVLDTLLAIWREIFGRKDIAASDDFFLLGGHSLKALQLQVHVRTSLDYEMDLRVLFDAPTVSELADFISAAQSRAAQAETVATETPVVAGNVNFHLRLERLDAKVWERCANQVVERHEMLRATLSVFDGAPRLRIAPYKPFALPVTDLSGRENAETEAERLLTDDAAALFDTHVGPLYRFAFYDMGQGRAIVSLIIAPGIGEAHLPVTVVLEMLSLYEAALSAPQAEVVSRSPISQLAITTRTTSGIDRNEAAAECIVPMRREGHRQPIFIVAGAGGSTMNLIEFARALSPDQPVYGVQAKGYSTRSAPLDRVEAMAAYYIEAIRAVQSTGPYALFGYSFGGVPAFEMAQQLQAQGEAVRLLGILDTVMNNGEAILTLAGPGLGPIASRALFRLREFLTTPLSEKSAYLKKRWRRFRFRTGMNRQVQVYRRLEAEGKQIPAELIQIQALSELSMQHYLLRPYPGKIVLFQSQEATDYMKGIQVESWNRVAGGGLEIVPVPGSHNSMLHGENALALARAAEAYLSPT